MGLRAAYAAKNYEIRPKLGRSCRCMLMLGHGYEPGVDLVLLILQYSNVSIVSKLGREITLLDTTRHRSHSHRG
jgi:hypothetical protein